MMGSVIESDKIQFSMMLLAMYDKDVQGLKKAILKFSSGLDNLKKQELEYDIIYFLRSYTNKSIENIDGYEVMRGLNSLFFDYKIKIPSKLLLLLKALVIIEGVGLSLDPDYDIIDNIGPFAQRLLTKKINPNNVKREIMYSLEENALLLKELPEDIREIIHKIKEGRLHIEFEHKGLQSVNQNFEISINRLSYTLIIVAIVVSSAIITIADIPPKIYNMPIIGVVGFVSSVFMALRLFWSISKHGRF